MLTNIYQIIVFLSYNNKWLIDRLISHKLVSKSPSSDHHHLIIQTIHHVLNETSEQMYLILFISILSIQIITRIVLLTYRTSKPVFLLFLYSLSCSPSLFPFIGYTSLHKTILSILTTILASHQNLQTFNNASFQYEGIIYDPLLILWLSYFNLVK